MTDPPAVTVDRDREADAGDAIQRPASLWASIGQSSARGVLPVLAIATIIGAILGAVAMSMTSSSYSATALVSGAPVSFDPSAMSTDTDTTYVKTEVAYINIYQEDIRDEIERRTGAASEPAAVSVLPGTTILAFVGSAGTPAGAAAVANVSAETYVQLWRTRVTTQLQESINILTRELASNPLNAPQLAAQRADLLTQLDAAKSLSRLIKPATAETAAKTSVATTGILLGGLVGALVGLGVLLVFRRRRNVSRAGIRSDVDD